VQRPLISADAPGLVFIHNMSRTLAKMVAECDAPRLAAGTSKAFYWALVENGRLLFGRPAQWQNW
jgi:hypothetical protein